MNRTWTIALHFNIGYEVSQRILHGVIQYAQEHPEIVLRDYNFSRETLDLPEPPPWRGKADGLLMNLGRDPGVGDWLRRGGVPVVNTGGDLASEKRVVSVFTDPRSVAGLAVRHFLDLGRQQFAFVGNRRADATKLLEQETGQTIIAALCNGSGQTAGLTTDNVLWTESWMVNHGPEDQVIGTPPKSFSPMIHLA